MNKIYVALATAAALISSVGYMYYHDEIKKPELEKPTKVVKNVETAFKVGIIDLDLIDDNLTGNERLNELRSYETRLKLELSDAMKPVIMTPPKVEDTIFDDAIWQKNAQTIISEAAEIEKRKKQAAEDYRKSTEAEYLKKRDEANDQFLNEIFNIKLKLQNADNMRLTNEQIEALENRLDEIQIERNELQRQLIEQWTQDIANHAEEAVKEEAEKLRAQAQESMAKVKEETQRAQEAVQKRNKAIMEQAMQESAARQDRRRQLITELQEVSAEREQLENKMLSSLEDIVTKLAVIHKLQLILARSNNISLPLNNYGAALSTPFAEGNSSIMIFDTSQSVNLTEELIKELQRQ